MFQKINKKGQGILEVMTAIYVFIIALVSIMNLVVFNIQINDLNADFLVASNLAREGIEAVRSIRDSNWESGRFFADDLRYKEKGEYIDNTTQSANITQATFLLKNKYLDNGYGYEVKTIGLSWANCISSTYPYSNDLPNPSTTELCRLYLISPNSDNLRKQYDYSIYNYSNTSKTATQFYRILYIIEICKSDLGSEKIMHELDLDGGTYNASKHCDNYSDTIGLRVVARVGWMSSHGFKEVRIEEKLYNWQADKDIGQYPLIED